MLNLLVNHCVEAGRFNACIELIDCDEHTVLEHVGLIGMGQRNARGTMLIHWISISKDGSLHPGASE